MEADRRIQGTEINDWMIALREAESGDWSDLHVQGARQTLQAMATSEESYTGADLYRAFASSNARETLKESVSADFHTLTAIDPEIWRELSRRAATLTGVSSGRFAEATETEEDDI
jgi:hypothetical protein